MASANWTEDGKVQFNLGTHTFIRAFKDGDDVNFPELAKAPEIEVETEEADEVESFDLRFDYTRAQLESIESFKELREFARPYGIKGTAFEEIINELMAAKEAH